MPPPAAAGLPPGSPEGGAPAVPALSLASRGRNTSISAINQPSRPRRSTSGGGGSGGGGGTMRERAATVAAGGNGASGGEGAADEQTRLDGLQQLANVLTDDSAPGQVSLENAPILGEQLMMVAQDGDEPGAGSVHELQRRVEMVMLDLQNRLHEQEIKFRKHWWNLDFDEADIEEEYRMQIFSKNRWNMIVIAVLVNLYNLVSLLLYAVWPITQREEPPNVNWDCLAAVNLSALDWSVVFPGEAWASEPSGPGGMPSNLTAVALKYPKAVVDGFLREQLLYRICMTVVLSVIVLALKFAPRRVMLGTLVLVYLSVAFFFDMALTNQNASDDLTQVGARLRRRRREHVRLAALHPAAPVPPAAHAHHPHLHRRHPRRALHHGQHHGLGHPLHVAGVAHDLLDVGGAQPDRAAHRRLGLRAAPRPGLARRHPRGAARPRRPPRRRPPRAASSAPTRRGRSTSTGGRSRRS